MIISGSMLAEEVIPKLAALESGQVFQYEGTSYETLVSIFRLANLENGTNFQIEPVVPGTPLYTTYGANSVVVL
jgi:hypothetical protein